MEQRLQEAKGKRSWGVSNGDSVLVGETKKLGSWMVVMAVQQCECT